MQNALRRQTKGSLHDKLGDLQKLWIGCGGGLTLSKFSTVAAYQVQIPAYQGYFNENKLTAVMNIST